MSLMVSTPPDTPDEAARAASREPARSGRGRAAAMLALAAAATGVCAVPAWITATTESVLGVPETIRVTGGAAASALVAAALVLLAATAAVALVGRLGRWVVVATVALAGVLVVAGAVGVLRDPAAAAAATVADRIGVERVTDDLVVTPWPWVALAVGVLDVLVAVRLARSSRGWAVTERHDRQTVPDRRAGAGAAPGRAPAPRREAGHPDDRDQWDALTRGDDPSEGLDGDPR